MFEAGSASYRPFFTGNIAPDADHTVAWAGATDASYSIASP